MYIGNTSKALAEGKKGPSLYVRKITVMLVFNVFTESEFGSRHRVQEAVVG